ncbi:zinc finger protein CONSTANS-LIKE 5-like [Vicia villosa]|uniref:zinc finger protein CONSTANS-LIKE 5-like n=1 Tax=Vicia villosa TaxID=3911 RepID=UPI00273CD997|nr:zinc finger protein CONSTANS-LIKE 5-like [Vicia villosa]
MSSDIYTFDISHHTHSTPNIFSYDPYYPFDFIDAVQEDFNNSLDPFFFSSPTTNHALPLTNGLNTNTELEDYHNNTVMDSANFQWHELNSSENSFFTGQIRRASSTCDSQTEEAKLLKVGRYSLEERKQKISKYRAKRKQRKFNKIIKYECRKTLADSRTRIRGRFARNDETSEIPKTPCSKTAERHCSEDELWVDLIEGLNEDLTSCFYLS